MASRLLQRSKALACISRPATLAMSIGVPRHQLHTSGVRLKLFSGRWWKIFQDDHQDAGTPAVSETKTRLSMSERLGVRRRQGGYERGGGMHLLVPIRAKNVEKAWDIWSTHLRQVGSHMQEITHETQEAQLLPSRECLVEFLQLLVNSAVPDSSDPTTSEATTEQDNRRLSVAGFRISALLRHIFALSVRREDVSLLDSGQSLSMSEPAAGTHPINFGLGSLKLKDYNDILSLIQVSGICDIPSGNTIASRISTVDDLSLVMHDMPLSRLAEMVVLAAIQDGVDVTAGILRRALEMTVAAKDVSAARDILTLCNSRLAVILDPQLVASSLKARPAAVDEPQSSERQHIIETLLQLIEVGQDPQLLAPGADLRVPQEEMGYFQLDDAVDFDKGQVSVEEKEATSLWRADAAERVYREYMSAGIVEVPSPEPGVGAALQGSVVPTSQMIASMLKIYANARNPEQTAILYETLAVVVAQFQAQSFETGAEQLKRTHRVHLNVWASILQAVSNAGQQWLAARVLGAMAGDGWLPTQAAYEDYLGSIADMNEADLIKAINELRNNMQENGVSMSQLSVREPLVCALVAERTSLSAEATAAQIEQALLLSGLYPNANRPGIVAVSDKTARSIMRAMLANGQIERARGFAEEWSAARPDLVDARCMAALILALGNAGRHSEALDLFVTYQKSGEGEIALDLLCAVFEVYMHAGDYAEAVSAGKRIRVLVNDSWTEGTLEALPGHDIYNSLIRAYCEEILPAEAMHVLEEMRRYGLNATPETYTILAKSMSDLRSFEGLRLVNALVNVDYNMVSPDNARTMWGRASPRSSALPLTTDYYNALMEAYLRVAEPTLALQIWEVMRFRGIRPDNLTATLLVDICGWNERVHWEEDMLPQKTFVSHEVPEDHIYTGVPLLHLHFLASVLQQLQGAGLELSIANYQHVAEAIMRAALVYDVVALLIGRFETPEESAAWERETKKVYIKHANPVVLGIAKFLHTEEDLLAYDDSQSVAKFMANAPDIPLCEETVNTVYGCIAAMRAKSEYEGQPEPHWMPIAQQEGPKIRGLLELHERRLDIFLKLHRPDLLPEDRRTQLS
ncbi:hypothetical protein COEREDRAFT_84138 [Coemansia reversa NRRL 1564]|uniref:Pentacotripeptide-repeat region of PRORP domain-containing protein n=1 Tax=Coemansia reversa (strain ATCC 12441 / NRRL 1564) TaxID=763665 RepID=A0A2G5BKF6_COERN|nr:hypothetical protein COEREDRAFT_84138 [Coemansia reversa NRRL 1564]|eukprot:PIA19496.1 hypothetical protein COEREDRAFT_84138 [Coemansia reversa NRRL 1564]